MALASHSKSRIRTQGVIDQNHLLGQHSALVHAPKRRTRLVVFDPKQLGVRIHAMSPEDA
jgi:hypothetical protein